MREVLEFITEISKLKHMPRSGWKLIGIKQPESIAGHTFGIVMLAWVFAKKKSLNIERVMKIALIHDLCEVYAGDMTPYDDLDYEHLTKKDINKLFNEMPAKSLAAKEKIAKDKREREMKSLDKVIINLPKDLQSEIKDLWLDYEFGKTREGRFVRQLDRLESLIQGFIYRKKYQDFPIRSFWLHAKTWVDDPDLVSFIADIEEYFSYQPKK